jgi:hypothetical protein
MKKSSFVTFCIILFAMLVNGQVKTNLIFFTEQGERFSVILNGILQNPNPKSNIKVTDLVAPNYKLKIKFADPKLGEIDKNLMFNQGTEATFVIKKNNKGEYVVRFMNEIPIEQSPQYTTDQEVITYTPTPAVTTTYTQSQTTTVTNGNNINPGNGSITIGVNMNDPNMNINMNMGDNGNPSTTTTTVTTTTTTSNVQSNNTDNNQNNDQPVYHDKRNHDQREHEHKNHNHSNNDTYVMPGYTGSIGCPWPMSQNDFDGVKNSISSKSFEDSKLTIAKQVIKSNCLLSSQVKEIMLLFSFEASRLDFAKFAYGNTYDISNYYKLNDAFTFESSIDELNKYISGYKH